MPFRIDPSSEVENAVRITLAGWYYAKVGDHVIDVFVKTPQGNAHYQVVHEREFGKKQGKLKVFRIPMFTTERRLQKIVFYDDIRWLPQIFLAITGQPGGQRRKE